MTGHIHLNDLIDTLLAMGSVEVELWPQGLPLSPEDLGLARSDDGQLTWPQHPELLDPTQLSSSHPDLDISYFRLIDSTNSQLVSRGSASTIANHLYLTEFQYGGRGRRGRNWNSPFARNLAMSLGFGTRRSLPELGGLSLVVGLALADALESLGTQGVRLKWPNDVLVQAEKLSGILIELVQRDTDVEVVIGVGVNVQLTDEEIERIGQPVTDLRRHGVTESRTELVNCLIMRVKAYLELFEAEGFAPFVSAFNDLHLFHGETCSIIHGSNTVTGVVIGVGEQGELIMQTNTGEQRFHGGEVSLRPISD